jgi:hypothetical protein
MPCRLASRVHYTCTTRHEARRIPPSRFLGVHSRATIQKATELQPPSSDKERVDRAHYTARAKGNMVNVMLRLTRNDDHTGSRSASLGVHEDLVVILLRHQHSPGIKRSIRINNRLKATISLLLHKQQSLHIAGITRIPSAIRRNSLSDFPFPAHLPSWSPSMALPLDPGLFIRFTEARSSKKLMHLLCILSTSISTTKP